MISAQPRFRQTATGILGLTQIAYYSAPGQHVEMTQQISVEKTSVLVLFRQSPCINLTKSEELCRNVGQNKCT